VSWRVFALLGILSFKWVTPFLPFALLNKHDGLLVADFHAFGFSFAKVTNQDPAVFFKERGERTFQNTEAASVTSLFCDPNDTCPFIPLKRSGRADLCGRAFLTLETYSRLIIVFRGRVDLNSGNR
jgi:hypothetical protein